jgi:hypothetical protein
MRLEEKQISGRSCEGAASLRALSWLLNIIDDIKM